MTASDIDLIDKEDRHALPSREPWAVPRSAIGPYKSELLGPRKFRKRKHRFPSTSALSARVSKNNRILSHSTASLPHELDRANNANVKIYVSKTGRKQSVDQEIRSGANDLKIREIRKSRMTRALRMIGGPLYSRQRHTWHR